MMFTVYINIIYIMYIYIYMQRVYTVVAATPSYPSADSKVLTSQRLIDEIVNGSNREKYQAPWQGSFVGAYQSVSPFS